MFTKYSTNEKNYVGKAEGNPLQEDERVYHAVKSQTPTSADFFVVFQNKAKESFVITSFFQSRETLLTLKTKIYIGPKNEGG